MDRVFNLLEKSARLREDLDEMKRNLYSIGGFDDPEQAAVRRCTCRATAAGALSVAEQRHHHQQRSRREDELLASRRHRRFKAVPTNAELHRLAAVDETDLRPRRSHRRRGLPKDMDSGAANDENKENSGAAAAAGAELIYGHNDATALLRMRNLTSLAAARCPATRYDDERRCSTTVMTTSRCRTGGSVICGGRPNALPPGERPFEEHRRDPRSITNTVKGERVSESIAVMSTNRRQQMGHSPSFRDVTHGAIASSSRYSNRRLNDETSVWSGAESDSVAAQSTGRARSPTASFVQDNRADADGLDLSRIIAGSPSQHACLREQTSSGELVGAFHSTFVYPLHSTMVSTALPDDESTISNEEQSLRRHIASEEPPLQSSTTSQRLADVRGVECSSSSRSAASKKDSVMGGENTFVTDDVAKEYFPTRGRPSNLSPIGADQNNIHHRPVLAVPVKYYFPPLSMTMTSLSVPIETQMGGASMHQQKAVDDYADGSEAVVAEISSSASSSTQSSRMHLRRQLAKSRLESDPDEATTVDASSFVIDAQAPGRLSPFQPTTSTEELFASDTSLRAVEGSTASAMTRTCPARRIRRRQGHTGLRSKCDDLPRQQPRQATFSVDQQTLTWRSSHPRKNSRHCHNDVTADFGTGSRLPTPCNRRAWLASERMSLAVKSVQPVDGVRTVLPPGESIANYGSSAMISRYERHVVRKRSLAKRFKLLGGCFCDGNSNNVEFRTLAYL